jgi:hypothetical protein
LESSRAFFSTNSYSVPALGRIRQEDCKFEVSLSYIAIPCLKRERERERHRERERERERKLFKKFQMQWQWCGEKNVTNPGN